MVACHWESGRRDNLSLLSESMCIARTSLTQSAYMLVSMRCMSKQGGVNVNADLPADYHTCLTVVSDMSAVRVVFHL